MKNQTAYLTEKKKIEIRDSEMPVCGNNDVLVEIKNVGICGSDMMFFDDPTAGGTIDTKLPIVLGHEASGIVIDKGIDVTDLEIGDTVAMEPGIPCGHCEQCMSGHYNLCKDVVFFAAPPFKTGAYSRYVKHPAYLTFKLPKGMSTVEGAMLEPFSVGLSATNHSSLAPSKRAVILGAGCIGQMTLLALKAAGVDHILITDLCDNRLNKAMELGAEFVVNSGKEDIEKTIDDYWGGKKADIVYETAGSHITAQLGSKLLAKKGELIIVGNIHHPVTLDILAMSKLEASLKTVWRYANTYPIAIDIASRKKVDLNAVVTNYFKFEDIQKAFEVSSFDKQNVVKSIIEF